MNSEFLQIKFPARLRGPLAIAHVTVVPMDTERTIPDQTVVIDGSTIRTVGPAAQVSTEGTQVVDGSGMFVLPGLGDMYTHYRQPNEAILYLSHGVTLCRTMGSAYQMAMGRVAERGDYPSPHLIPISPSIDGVDGAGRTDMPGGVPMAKPEQAEGLVNMMAERGFHQIKTFSLMTQENLKAVVKEASARGLKVTVNCPNAMSWEEAMDAGVYCLDQFHLIARDHLQEAHKGYDYWDRFDPFPGTYIDFDSIRPLARRLAKEQVWSVPTLVFHQRASQPVEISMEDPSLKYVAQSTISDWEHTIVRWSRRGRTSVDEWRKAARIRAEAFLKIISIMHEEGAPIMPGTDSVNPYIVQGDSLHQELFNFVKAGMSPYEALRTATTEPARFLGQSDVFGTVAEGKRADLVLLGANPLQDIAALGQIKGVTVNGYYLPRQELDRLMEDRATTVNRPPTLPATFLPAATGSRETAGEGTWDEQIYGSLFGRVSFRHTKLPSGEWHIEERYASATPRSHLDRRTMHLTLTPDFKVKGGTYTIESDVGEESGEIVYNQGKGYTVRMKEVDGYSSEVSVSTPDGAMTLPSETLLVSLPPRLFVDAPDQVEGKALPTLSAGSESPLVADMAFSRVKGGVPAGEAHWKLSINRASGATEQTYRLTGDGLFLGESEIMPLLWPRELNPVSDSVDER